MRERPALTGYHEVALEVVSPDLAALFAEAGGHRIQRVPPTERRGRVHTSTVTVAVLGSDAEIDQLLFRREPADFRIEYFSGTGAGGQHRNKHQNSVRLVHIPTGLKQERQSRGREANLTDAKSAIVAELDNLVAAARNAATAADRRTQVGSGMRGDKIRTYRFQDDAVVDHRTGKSARASLVMRGQFELLW